MTASYSTTLEVSFAVLTILFLIGCGGQTAMPPTPAQPQIKVTTITADQVFSTAMIGQAWFFEGTCGGDVLDTAGKVLVTYPMQPFHTTINIEHGTAFTYAKDVDCGYWAIGIKGAQLFDFALERDPDGGWYNTGGHVVMPFGCPWCQPVDSLVDFTYTVPPPADKTLPRAYQIIPPKGDDQHKIILKTEYGDVPWETDAYIEHVDTPVFSGMALVSEQTENVCAHEKWYFAPGIGLVQVNAYHVEGCSGLQTDVIMKRVR